MLLVKLVLNSNSMIEISSSPALLGGAKERLRLMNGNPQPSPEFQALVTKFGKDFQGLTSADIVFSMDPESQPFSSGGHLEQEVIRVDYRIGSADYNAGMLIDLELILSQYEALLSTLETSPS